MSVKPLKRGERFTAGALMESDALAALRKRQEQRRRRSGLRRLRPDRSSLRQSSFQRSDRGKDDGSLLQERYA
jgi:hypothetical protein